MPDKIKTLLACAALSLLLAGVAHAAQIVDEIEAIVDQKAIITSSEVDEIAATARGTGDAAEIRAGAFNVAVDKALIQLEAKQRKIFVGEAEVDNAAALFRSSSGLSELEFLDQLAKEGIAYARYREELKAQILATKLTLDLVKSEYPSMDAALLEYFKRHKEDFSSSGWVRVLHAQVDGPEAAGKILDMIKDGRGFAEATAAVTGEEPADTGKLSTGDLSAEVSASIDGLKAGQTSAPAALGGKLYLFHLAEAGGGEASFDAVRDEVYKRFMSGGMSEVLENWLSVRREEARVQKMR